MAYPPEVLTVTGPMDSALVAKLGAWVVAAFAVVGILAAWARRRIAGRMEQIAAQAEPANQG